VLDFSQELQMRRAQGLYRRLHVYPTIAPPRFPLQPAILNFASNDYLNLSRHPRLQKAAAKALKRWGCGACASRLVCGTHEVHEALEKALAEFMGTEAALAYPSGYQGNIGVLSALAGREDAVFSDALNHASLIDGIRLSRAAVYIYRHGDVEHLESLLCTAPPARRRFIVTDAVFSMDGDVAPLPALSDLAGKYEAALIVDEAHALGIFGEGRGLCAELGVTADVRLGTLSKAFGAAGGFAACTTQVREWLINSSRAFIFSTGLAPACAASALEALTLIRENPTWGLTLRCRAQRFAEYLSAAECPVSPAASAIVPVVIGNNDAVVGIAEALRAENIWVGAIRPPSVPEGTARLRLALTLAHDDGVLEHAAASIATVVRRYRGAP
jgi:8-amino-7-oxononanoate synthase